MKLFLRLLTALWLLPLAAEARLVAIKKENVSVEIPREWSYELSPKLKAPWGKLALTAKGADEKFLLLAVKELPGADAAQAQAHFGLLQEPARQQGWVVSNLREVLIDGMPLYLFTVTRHGSAAPDILMATAFTKDRAYTLQLGDPKGNVDESEVLQAILESFRLLTPRSPLQLQIVRADEPARPMSAPVPTKWVVGGVLGAVALIAVVQVFLWYRSRRRRHRRRERRQERERMEAERAQSGAKD